MSETYDLPGLEPGPGPGPGAGADGDLEPAAPPDAGVRTAVAETERAPEPLGVTVGATGNAEVDTAVERLSDADELPTDAHLEVYEDVHSGLRDALTALDENRG
jgi:hypothetical protein